MFAALNSGIAKWYDTRTGDRAPVRMLRQGGFRLSRPHNCSQSYSLTILSTRNTIADRV
jgi:hypothetical protein